MYVEASGANNPRKTAYLTSAWGHYTGVAFKYHMYGQNMGSLTVEVLRSGAWHAVWERRGEQHRSSSAAWSAADVPFAVPATRVRLVGTTGMGYRGDAAVADVRLVTAGAAGRCSVSWRCPSGSGCFVFAVSLRARG